MLRRILPITMGLVIVAVWSYFFFQTRDIHAGFHARFVEALRQYKQNDATLEQDILKLRFGLLNNFDSVVKTLGGQRRLQDSIEAVSSEELVVRPRIYKKVKELRDLLEEKDELVSLFVEESTLLNNSLRFFPIAAIQLVRKAQEQVSTGSLQMLGPVDELVRDVLIYNNTSDAELRKEIQTDIETLKAIRQEYPEVLVRDIDVLIAHAGIIFEQKGIVDDLIRQIFAISITQNIEEVYGDYDKFYSSKVRLANFYQIGSYVAGLLLLFMVVGIFVKR